MDVVCEGQVQGRERVNIGVRDALIEGNDYGLFMDNSTWFSSGDALDNVNFESTEFLMNDIVVLG